MATKPRKSEPPRSIRPDGPGRLNRDSVLIARNLGPAELLEYDRRRLKAVVLEEGSLTAHMTIVARAMGVPVVGRIGDIRHVASEGDTVLVDGDDMNDPIGDSVRSIVDGHVVLSRSLAHKGHYPAVDVLQSASRVMRNVIPDEHFRKAMFVRDMLATYREAEDLINIGAYKSGASPKIDLAIKMQNPIEAMLKQDVNEHTSLADAQRILMHLG